MKIIYDRCGREHYSMQKFCSSCGHIMTEPRTISKINTGPFRNVGFGGKHPDIMPIGCFWDDWWVDDADNGRQEEVNHIIDLNEGNGPCFLDDPYKPRTTCLRGFFETPKLVEQRKKKLANDLIDFVETKLDERVFHE